MRCWICRRTDEEVWTDLKDTGYEMASSIDDIRIEPTTSQKIPMCKVCQEMLYWVAADAIEYDPSIIEEAFDKLAEGIEFKVTLNTHEKRSQE